MERWRIGGGWNAKTKVRLWWEDNLPGWEWDWSGSPVLDIEWCVRAHTELALLLKQMLVSSNQRIPRHGFNLGLTVLSTDSHHHHRHHHHGLHNSFCLGKGPEWSSPCPLKYPLAAVNSLHTSRHSPWLLTVVFEPTGGTSYEGLVEERVVIARARRELTLLP